MSPLELASLAVSVTSSCGWWFALSGWRREREAGRRRWLELIGELAELESELAGLELERRGVTYGGHGQAPTSGPPHAR